MCVSGEMITVKWLLMMRGDDCFSTWKWGEDGNNKEGTDGLIIGADDFQFIQCVLIHWKDDL